MTKEELRGQMRAMRAELTGDKRDAAEQQAADHMMAFLRQKRPRRFYPFGVLPYRDRYTSVIAESVERTAGNSSGSASRGRKSDAFL